MSFIIIYVTHSNIDEAKKIINYLIEKKLIACSNFLPIDSCYWWHNEIESTNEIVSILKTCRENWDIVKDEIERLHPYKTPCIMKIDVESIKSYEDWIKESTIRD